MTETDTRKVLDRLKNTVESLKLMHELKGKAKDSTNRRRYKYDWHKISVGESFLVACKDSWAEKLKTLNSLAHPPKQELAAGKRFRRESCAEGVRVWRVK